jgi:hypothetical protein
MKDYKMVNINRIKKRISEQVTISANDFKIYNFQNNPETDDYTPFKNIKITNKSNADIFLYINGESGFIDVPSGTFYEDSNLNIYDLKIENIDPTNEAKFSLMLDNHLSLKELMQIVVLGQQEVFK